MVRAFIAVDINDPETVRQIMNMREELLRVGGGGLKPVDPENLHITLWFLGEIGEAEVDMVSEALRKIDVDPFSITLSGLGYFPGGGRINVIWVGVSNGAEELQNIHSKLERSLTGIKLEKQKFTPHLTICRVKYVTDKNALLDVIKRNSKKFFGEQKVDKIALKKSVLTPSGPIYSDITVHYLWRT